MKHGSLFSGIGGFDLAADWMGWENIFHCEIAEFPRKILNHYWPNAECHEDIKKTDFTKYRGTVDIISGGFPCQPYSAAGKRLGKEDDRHLWPEMLRVIREVKPQWVVGENVRGLLNWNGGMVFHEVCADLENIGYEVQAFIIPASGINAPHQRERLWIVAHSSLYANGLSTEGRMDMGGELLEGREREEKTNGFGIISKDATDTQNYGRKTDERINNGTKYKSNDRGTIRNIFNTDGKQRDASDSDKHGRQEQYRNMGEENGKKEEQRNEFIWNAIKSSSKDRNATDTESLRINRAQKYENNNSQSRERRRCDINNFSKIQRGNNAPNSDLHGFDECNSKDEINASEREFNALNDIDQSNGIGNIADSKGERLEGLRRQKERYSKLHRGYDGLSNWQNFPTQSPVCGGDDGISAYSHDRTIQNENTMDRTLVIKSAIDAGRLMVDIETGKIYSTVTKSNVGDKVELKGADCNGYRVHNISFGGIKKQCRAHQIVWIYANGVYDKDVLMIDHINRNKSDNRLSNLRLVDAKGNRENVNEYEGKLTQDEKDTMYFIYAEGHMSIRELAEDFGISKSRVHQLLSEHKGLDNITFPKWRNESIKGYGNAVVPQVVYRIFKTIEYIQNLKP